MSEANNFCLHDAVMRCDEAEVLRLIRSGMSLDELDEHGMSPLHCAVYGGYLELVQMLISYGADVNIKSRYGDTPIWHAEDDFGLYDIANCLRGAGAKK